MLRGGEFDLSSAPGGVQGAAVHCAVHRAIRDAMDAAMLITYLTEPKARDTGWDPCWIAFSCLQKVAEFYGLW